MKIFVDKKLVCTAEVADTFSTRLKGLMFRRKMIPFSGLLLKNCSSIHTCFMKFPIDVIYLDRNNVVLDSETVAPSLILYLEMTRI